VGTVFLNFDLKKKIKTNYMRIGKRKKGRRITKKNTCQNIPQTPHIMLVCVERGESNKWAEGRQKKTEIKDRKTGQYEWKEQ
jgi:hypothetical protein